jgi:rhodanese-related sulfurtransferase
MKMFVSSSPMFSPPNAFMVFHLPSGETAIAGTSWFSIEPGEALVTVSVQKPDETDGWIIPEEFGLNLLPRDFAPVSSSSFPFFQKNVPLPDIPEMLGGFIYGEIPSLAACPVVFICRKGKYYNNYNQLIISAVITEVFIHGKKETPLPSEIFLEKVHSHP